MTKRRGGGGAGWVLLLGGAVVGGLALSGKFDAKPPPGKSRPEPVGEVRGEATAIVAKLQATGFRRETFWEGADAVPAQSKREFAWQMADRARAAGLAPGEALAAHMPEAQNIIAVADARGVQLWWK